MYGSCVYAFCQNTSNALTHSSCTLVGGPRIYHDKGRCSQAGLSLASLLIICYAPTHTSHSEGNESSPEVTCHGMHMQEFSVRVYNQAQRTSNYYILHVKIPLGRCLTAYSNSAENKGTGCPEGIMNWYWGGAPALLCQQLRRQRESGSSHCQGIENV